jgi:3-oxoadipate enol-lactonase
LTDSSDALAGVPATSYLSPRVRQYADHAKAANIRRAYRIDWDDFVGWCELHRCAPLPALETVAEYLVSLADSGAKIATIQCRLSSLSVAHLVLVSAHLVLAFDNRGAGRTDKPDVPYSIEVMAEDTAGLMHALGWERATVIGISLGGRIAMELALTHPQQVTGLILVSTSAKVVRRARVRMLGLLSGLPLLRGRYPQPRYAFRRQLEASTGYDCTDRLDQLRMPVVIMHGKNDRSARYALAQEMHACITSSRMITFSGGHLFPLMGERQRFLDSLTETLRPGSEDPL